MALEQNLAEPRSLATADFDEDGMPDLVAGYAYNGRGIVTLARGNVDSIYPNAPEAKQRKLEGAFTNAPFLSPAKVFDASVPPDFLGVGDFDADGHMDVVFAACGGTRLNLWPGDGMRNFGAPKELLLDGGASAFAVGEINRRDGLPDIVVATGSASGNNLYTFEGPLGAFNAAPERWSSRQTVTSIALGDLDSDYVGDFVAACGDELMIVHGRDRKLALRDADRTSVSPPNLDTRKFPFEIRALTIGEFNDEGASEIALITNQGELLVLSEPGINNQEKASGGNGKGVLLTTVPRATDLLSAHVSTSALNDLLVIDSAGKQLSVVSQHLARKSAHVDGATTSVTSFTADDAPRVVLPMRLNSDAIQDLVILSNGTSSPTVLESSAAQPASAPPGELNFVSFSNTNPITMPSGFASPPRAANTYPSTINVSAVTGTIDKLRVRLNNVSMSSFEQDIDILLVGPTGQKMLLMSDVDTSCIISNANLTFDDNALLDLAGFNCEGGIYKPKDNPPADTFPAPAPAAPYEMTLASFNGTNPNGTWSLYMVDDASSFGSGQTIGGGWTIFFGPDSPSTFIVNSTANTDDGQCTAAANGCTLKEAINAANDHLGADNITFNIAGPTPYTIDGILPAISEPVSIDATTQPGFAGTPIIEKTNGGFGLNGGGTLIRGFVINTNGGISIQKAGNNIIEGNYIGINVAGTAAKGPLGNNGITIDTSNNVVGGTAAQARNVIANQTYGIQFSTFEDDPNSTVDDASNNLIAGNYIGLNAAGTAIIQISHAAITSRSAPGSPGNTIGGTTAGARNVIAGGSSASGIDLVYSRSHDYLIQGNYIGTDATATIKFSSDGFFPSGNNEGINLEGTASAITIGGTTPGARNIISGNSNGIFMRDSGTSNNMIQGNYIGTDVTGTKSITNTVGIRTIFDANFNTIGGATTAARNIISGNIIAGIQFGEPTKGGAVNNVVQGNYIGTDVTGDTALPNGRTSFFDGDAGIVVPANSRADRIIQNRIAYNKGDGIRITNVSGNDINSIEIEIADNEIYANQGLGIDLGAKGITPNDPLDADDGPNRLQNFPVLTAAVVSAAAESVWEHAGEVGREMPDPMLVAALTINGTLNSAPNTNFTVHWYFSADTQCTTNQAATRPLAFGKVPNVITDGSGNAMFSIPFDFPSGINGGIINCTATDPLGNTSEFSACFPLGNPGPTPTPTPTATPTPTPTPTGPMIFVEPETNNLAAVDSVSLVRGPFALTNTHNFSSDQRTRIIFFTTDLGLPQTFQPATSTLAVLLDGNPNAVESVGPNSTISGSYIVFLLPNSLSAGPHSLGIRLNGSINSTNTPNLQIISSPTSSPAATPKSNKAKLAKYLLFSILDLIL